MKRLSPVRSAALAGFLICLFAVVGCSDSKAGKLVPVSGKVTTDGGQPLTVGTVTFLPDESKGNTSKFSPSGMVDSSGSYKLTTDNREGAPPGWYKVGVAAQGMSAGGMPGGDPGVVSDPTKTLAKGSPVNAKYQNPTTSGISIEVVESPAAGAYDLKVGK